MRRHEDDKLGHYRKMRRLGDFAPLVAALADNDGGLAGLLQKLGGAAQKEDGEETHKLAAEVEAAVAKLEPSANALEERCSALDKKSDEELPAVFREDLKKFATLALLGK